MQKFPIEVYNEFFYSKPGSFRLLAYITDYCNYNCEYCYNVFPRMCVNFDLDKLYDFITKVILEKYNKKYLYLDLIGGETTIHPKLLDFCKRLQKFDNIYTTVYSNFSKPIEYYNELIACNVHLLLSWHSVCDTEEFKSKFAKFSYDSLQNYITLAIMYEHKNIEKSLEVFDYFYDTYHGKLKELEFSILDSNNNYNGYTYTDEQMAEFNARAPKTKTPMTLIKYNDGTSVHVNDNYFFKDVKNTNFQNWICAAGVDFLYVYIDGTVHPCDEHDGIVLFNLNNCKDIMNFKMPKHMMACNREHCPCLFDLYKKKVFKHDIKLSKA